MRIPRWASCRTDSQTMSCPQNSTIHGRKTGSLTARGCLDRELQKGQQSHLFTSDSAWMCTRQTGEFVHSGINLTLFQTYFYKQVLLFFPSTNKFFFFNSALNLGWQHTHYLGRFPCCFWSLHTAEVPLVSTLSSSCWGQKWSRCPSPGRPYRGCKCRLT